MSDALESAYPATPRQTGLVHLIRHSLDLTGWKDRKALAAALRTVYTAPTAETAAAALDAFAAGPWGTLFPSIVKPGARVRTIIKTRGHFPTDEAATTLIWLALRNITADWSKPAHHWKAAMNQFALVYDDRFLKGPA